MKKLYMKIVGYDEYSGSLLIKCASDETKSQNPDDYEALAYQPGLMYPDIDDPNEIKNRLAVACVHVAQQQARKDALQSDTQKNSFFQSMVGSTTEYDTENNVIFKPASEIV
jgi:hypothetical protein